MAHGDVRCRLCAPSPETSQLSGPGQSGVSFCFLFGTTIPLSAARLAALYPSHARFVARWSADALAGAARGFLRPADAAELILAAAKSSVGGPA